MRLRRQPEAKGYILASEMLVKEPEGLAGKWSTIFPTGPLHLEIGMGKGRFITDCASRYPQCNYLGLELREEMIMTAVKRLQDEPPPNLRFLWLNAADLTDIFAAGEVDAIYLNFSDPWPKKRHAQRRLTDEYYLSIYEKILRPGGQIHYKTDNRDFYFWSLEKFMENNWRILEKSADIPLKAHDVMTEYEEKYRQKGLPIYYCRLQKK